MRSSRWAVICFRGTCSQGRLEASNHRSGDPMSSVPIPEIPKAAPTLHSDGPMPISESPSRPSMVPDLFADDSPTQSHALALVTGPVVTSPASRPMLTVLAGLDEGQVFT